MPRGIAHVEQQHARQITLKAIITRTRPAIKHFVVHYRVWDTKGKGEVKGSYKLHIEKEATADF